MDQAWRSINGFFVSFMSSFDQLKIYFYTEPKKSFLKTVNHHRLRTWSSGEKCWFTDLASSEGLGSNPFEADFS